MLQRVVNIPANLQPRPVGGGAKTVAQQRDIKQYGSEQAAKQVRHESTRTSQISAIQKELAATHAEFNRVAKRDMAGSSQTTKQRYQTIEKGLDARLGELNKALASLESGGTYSDVNKVVAEIKQYGESVRIEEARQLKNIKQRSQSRKSQPQVPEGGYSRVDADKKIIYTKDGAVYDVVLKSEAGKQQALAMGEKVGYHPDSPLIVKDQTQTSQNIPAQQTSYVGSAQASGGPTYYYADIDDISMRGDTPTLKGDSTIYTSPQKTGKTYRADELTYATKDFDIYRDPGDFSVGLVKTKRPSDIFYGVDYAWKSRDFNKLKLGQRIDRDTTTGSLTMAFDMGDGMIQDVKLYWTNGKISKIKETGSMIPLEKSRFKEIKEQEARDGKMVFDDEVGVKTKTPQEIDRLSKIYSGDVLETPTPDKNFMLYNTYGMGMGGTVSYRPTTMTEKYEMTQHPEFDTFGGALGYVGGKIKEGASVYQKHVVTPIAKSTAFRWTEDKIIKPLSKHVVMPTTATVKKGVKYYEETVVRPLSEKGISVGGKQIIAPLGRDNPIADIAEAKRNIDEISRQYGEDAMVNINIGGKTKTVPAKQYSKLGLIAFMQKVYGDAVQESWKQAAIDVGVSEKSAGYVGSGAKLIQEFSPYLVPGYFSTKVGSEMAEAQFGSGTYGGPKDIIEYTKQHPVEVGFVAAGGLLKGVKYLKGVGKDKIIYDEKYKKFLLKHGDKKTIQLIEQTKKVQSRTYKETGLSGKIKKIGDRPTIKTLTKTNVRDKLRVEVEQSTGIWKGHVKEIHNVGGKEITYKGTGVYKNGKYVETINLGDGMIKITTITNNGTGVVRILKNNKEVIKLPISGAKLPPMVESKPIVKEGLFSSPPGKKTLEMRGSALATKRTQTDATSYMVGYKGKTSMAHSRSVKYGVNMNVVHTSSYIDYVKTKPYIQIQSAKKGYGQYTYIKQQTPQNIMYGNADDITKQLSKSDSSYFIKYQIPTTPKPMVPMRKPRSVELLDKTIRPKSLRLIQQKTSGIATYTYGDDVVKAMPFKKAAATVDDVSKKLVIPVDKISKGRGVKSLSNLSPGKYSLIKSDSGKVVLNKITPKQFYDIGLKKGQSGMTKFTVRDGGKIIHLDYVVAKKSGTHVGKDLIKDMEKISSGKTIVVEDASGIPGYYESLGYKKGSGGVFTEYSKNILPKQDNLLQDTFFVSPIDDVIASQTMISPPLNIIGTAQIPQQSRNIIGGVTTMFASAIKTDTIIDTKLITTHKINQTPTTQKNEETMTDTRSDADTKFATDSISKKITTPIIQPIGSVRPQPTSPTPPPLTTPSIPRGGSSTNIPIIIDINFGGRRPDDLVQAYKAEVLTKSGYKKVTDKPHTKKGARDFIARVLDNTTAATGRMVPMKNKVEESKLKKGDGYYNKNRMKYRGYKIVKGSRVALENTLIEKRGYRSDTKGEKSGLTASQYKARISKRAAGLPTRKTKRKAPYRL